MGRTRSFDVDDVVDRAAQQFSTAGFEATSLDDLLRVTGLHRGSLYQTFASKRGLFLAALDRARRAPTADRAVDLTVVALVELAPSDPGVRAAVDTVLDEFGWTAAELGERLLRRAGLDPALSRAGLDPALTRHEEE